MTTARSYLVYAATSIVVSLALSCGFVVYYVTESNQKLCTVLSISTTPRPKPPADPTLKPETQFGKDLLEYNKEQQRANDQALREVKTLMHEYRCPEAK